MVLLHAKTHEKPEPPPRCNLHRRVLLQSCCLRLDELCRLSQGQAMETLRGRKKQGKLIHRKHKLVDGCRRLILEHENRIISEHTDKQKHHPKKHLDWHWQQARNEGTHALPYIYRRFYTQTPFAHGPLYTETL